MSRHRLMAKVSTGGAPCVEISGDLDRHAAEALRLEIRRMARRYGIDIKEIRIERPEEKHSP